MEWNRKVQRIFNTEHEYIFDFILEIFFLSMSNFPIYKAAKP